MEKVSLEARGELLVCKLKPFQVREKELALSLQPLRIFHALAQCNDLRPTAEGFGEVVGHLDDGQTGSLLLAMQQVSKQEPVFDIQGRKGFVQQQDLRPAGKCLAQRRPLPLTSGDLMRLFFCQVGDTHSG